MRRSAVLLGYRLRLIVKGVLRKNVNPNRLTVRILVNFGALDDSVPSRAMIFPPRIQRNTGYQGLMVQCVDNKGIGSKKLNTYSLVSLWAGVRGCVWDPRSAAQSRQSTFAGLTVFCWYQINPEGS